MRELRPAIVHTRNVGAIEAQALAFLLRCPARIHSVHGFEMADVLRPNRKQALLSRLMRPFIHHYIAVSRHLGTRLVHRDGVPSSRVTVIPNGVDVSRFLPAQTAKRNVLPSGFAPEGVYVIGTVGRMEAVKDQVTLVKAPIQLSRQTASTAPHHRLVIAGEGSCMQDCRKMLSEAGLEQYAWLPGARSDISEIFHALDVFVLPSLAEGMSNTILEAMASGLPVIATAVGGNPELVLDEVTGVLMPPQNVTALCDAIRRYATQPRLAKEHGCAGRRRMEADFGLDTMIARYLEIYDGVLSGSWSARAKTGAMADAQI